MSQEAEFYYKRAIQRQDIEEYYGDLARAIELDPKNLAFREARAESAMSGDRFDIALEDLDVLIEQTTDGQKLIYFYKYRVLAYQQTGQFERAILDINWLISHGYSPGYGQRGLMALTLKRYEDAVLDFTIALEQQDLEIPAWLLFRARAHYHLGQYEEAHEDLLQIITSGVNFDKVSTHYLLGKVYYKLGDFEQSLHFFNKFASESRMPLLADARAYMEKLVSNE